jgi:hypothetical protein
MNENYKVCWNDGFRMFNTVSRNESDSYYERFL